MITFPEIADELTILERRQFERIHCSFRWPEDLKPNIRGSIQCYAVDKSQKNVPGERLPVICAVGINYTQNVDAARMIFSLTTKGASESSGRPHPLLQSFPSWRRTKETGMRG